MTDIEAPEGHGVEARGKDPAQAVVRQDRPSGEQAPKAESTQAQGLTQEEAERRLSQYGPNEIVEHKENPLLRFLSYFWGPIPWMIEAAAILSLIVRHWTDMIIISVLLVANGLVGFWEEYQAGNAIEALKQHLALKAKVMRGGRWMVLAARDLVPGDRVRLRLGDIIPADIELLDGDPIEVDQSSLTGESLPVTHKPGDTVYSGSIVKMGEIDGGVTATGERTYFAKTAQLVDSAHTRSHLQEAVIRIGNYLIVLAIALVTLILTVAVIRGDPLLTTIEFALVLTVAAVPVAMPTVLSVTMAVGARVLASKQAVVSRLASIEEVAGIDVLCSDKTGTLTQNKLTPGDPYLVSGVSRDDLMRAAALASRAEDQDPIDLAILSQADLSDLGDRVVHFQPFDPVSKRTEARVQAADGGETLVSKGAPQVILALVEGADSIRSSVQDAIDGFAHRGFRSLGVARKPQAGGWDFLGILPLFDPPREDSKSTIETAEAMGIKVKMVTGDQVAIAKETAHQLGLGSDILDAQVFDRTEASEERLVETVEKSDGFAQVFPEHKFRIVESLQARHHIVGMTGDGVNDAPALKKADAGIAVSGATDAARAAADIVLMTSGLSVVIDAVKESRKIFQRMNSYAIYRIAETIRVLLFMTLSILVFNFYPVTAVMIVLLALLNDGAILSISVDRVHYSDQPERWNMQRVLAIATVLGVFGVMASFGMFYIGERVLHLSQPVIQSLMYLKLSVAGQLTIFVTRTRGPFWSIRPSRILLLAVAGAQTIATLVTVFGVFMAPIGWGLAAFIWVYAVAWALVNDRVKLAAYAVLDRFHVGLPAEASQASA